MYLKDYVLDALGKFATKIKADRAATSYKTNVNITVKGLSVKAWVPKNCEGLLAVSIQGTTNAALNISAAYEDLFTLSSIADSVSYNHIAYVPYSNTVVGQLVVTSDGKVRIGYPRNMADGTAVNIASGTAVRIEHVFFLN